MHEENQELIIVQQTEMDCQSDDRDVKNETENVKWIVFVTCAAAQRKKNLSERKTERKS